MTPLARLRVRGDAAHGVRIGGVGQVGVLVRADLAIAHRQLGPRMVLQDVRLPFGARLVHLCGNVTVFKGPPHSSTEQSTHLVAVLAVVVSRGAQNGQVQFGHRVRADVRMPLRQVVDQHAPPLEAYHARVALVDETMVIRGLHLGREALRVLHVLLH